MKMLLKTEDVRLAALGGGQVLVEDGQGFRVFDLAGQRLALQRRSDGEESLVTVGDELFSVALPHRQAWRLFERLAALQRRRGGWAGLVSAALMGMVAGATLMAAVQP